MIGLFINNDLLDLSLRHLYFAHKFKVLPLRIQNRKTEEIFTFTVEFSSVSRFVKSGQKPFLPGILENCVIYFCHVERIIYFLSPECKNRCVVIAFPGLSCFRVLVLCFCLKLFFYF